MTHELTLTQLLDKNRQATRPDDTPLNSIAIKLHLKEPEFAVDILYQAMRPNICRVDVQMEGKTVFVEAYSGEFAWQIPGNQAPVVASAEGTDALLRGAIGNLYALSDFSDFGYQLEMGDQCLIEEALYYPVKVTFDGGHVVHYYMDAQSFLITLKREEHALHPDIDATVQSTETRYFDFRDVDGFKWAFRSEKKDLQTGNIIQEDFLRDVVINPSLKAEIFQMPTTT